MPLSHSEILHEERQNRNCLMMNKATPTLENSQREQFIDEKIPGNTQKMQ